MKKEKKKGSCLKTVLIAFGVLVVLGVIGSAFGDNDSDTNNRETQNSEPMHNESVPPETESTSDDDPLGFNVMFSDTYRNDVTGNWRLARIAEDINIEEYALDYYNNYFKSDKEIHIVINFTRKTTTRIAVMGNLLEVSIMEYVDKEEHDAKIACSGMLLKEYHVNIDTGEIEEIQEIPDLCGTWKSPNNEGSYQEAVITENTIEINWVTDNGNTKAIYWIGSYTAPTEATDTYEWTSVRDKEKTDTAIMASTDDTKVFSYSNGKLSYTVSALGTTTTLELTKE